MRHFELLAEHSRDIVLFVAHDGRLLDANLAAERAYGYGRAELLALCIQDLRAPETRPMTQQQMAEAEQGGLLFETLHRRKDGSVFPVEVSSQGALIDGAPTLVSVIRDITERKRAEDALRYSEQRFRTFFDLSASGAVEADVATRRFLRVNRRFCEITGYAEDELLQLTFADITHPDDHVTDVERHLRLLRGEIRDYEVEKRYVRKDGGVVWVHASVALATDSAGRPVRTMGVILDVTARKRAELARIESEEKFRASFANAVIGFAMAAPDGRLLDANAAYCAITGYSIEELRRMRISDLVTPEDEPDNTRQLARLLRGEVPDVVIENRYRRPDGSLVWARKSVALARTPEGAPRWLIALIEDITERRQAHDARSRAEEALRQSESHFRQVVESLPQLVWTCRADGPCDYLSPQWLAYTGRPAAEQLGYGWLLQLHPDDRQSTIDRWQSTARQGDSFAIEFRLRRHDGEYHWFHTLALPLRDESGRIIKWFGTNTDVTDLRAAQEVLARSKEELERRVAERTASLQGLIADLEHFSYTITHDMRAPLRAMRGFAELCLDPATADPARQRDYLRRIMVAADRMDALIRDALNYSRSVREELPLESVDVARLIRDILDSYPEFQPGRAQITVEAGLPVVRANAAGLTQCFSNLLGNAVKFVRPGETARVRIWSESRGEWARIWVEDHGIGIAASMLPRVFDLFARGQRTHEGTGVGLALVRKVVDRMKGRVGAESDEGQGSRFWIELRKATP